MKKKLLVIAVTLSSVLYSQNELIRWDFIDSKIHLYAIGEDHTEKNTELQFEIIKYLQENVHLKTIIQEVPVEVGEILNQIALTGENQEIVAELFRYYPSQARKNNIALMDSIIKMNQKLAAKDKVGVKGIDFVYHPDHNSIVSTLRIIFPELKECTIPLVKETLFSKKKSKLKKEESLIVLKQLLEDVVNNKELYRNCLGLKIENYRTILYNTIHYKEFSKWEDQAFFREGILTRNLISVFDTSTVSLLICGSSHLTRIESDEELLWDTSYPTMIANADLIHPNSIYTIVTQYYKEKKWVSRWIFGETNFLKEPMEKYIDKKTTKYLALSGNELKKHSTIANRCDMIIIQNNKYKKRKR